MPEALDLLTDTLDVPSELSTPLPTNNDIELSPQSKKVLTECAAPTATMPPLQDSLPAPSFILRPPSSGMGTTPEFQFARSARPVQSYSSRPGPRLPVSYPVSGSPGQAQCELSKEHEPPKPNDNQESSALTNLSPNRETETSKSQNSQLPLTDVHERPFSPSLQQITNFSQRRDKSCHNPQSSSSNPRPRGPSDTDSTTNRDTVYEPQSKGTIISQDKGVVFGNNVSESQELALHIASSVERTNMPPSTQTHPSSIYPSQAAHHEPVPPSRVPHKSKKTSSVVHIPTNRVSKKSSNRAGSRQTYPSMNERTLSGRQLSEEDLFHMLIHKLRRRDEAEVVLTALQERLQDDIRHMSLENQRLQSELEKADLWRRKQNVDMASQHGMIERWKDKFAKLKSLVASVGSDCESLARDSQNFKAERSSLDDSRKEISDIFSQVSASIKVLAARQNTGKEIIGRIITDFASVQQSLLLAESKVEERGGVIQHERNHAAALESHIQTCTVKHARQVQLILDQQSGMLPKIDELQEVARNWKGTYPALQNEIQRGFCTCFQFLGHLNDQQSVTPLELGNATESIQKTLSQLYELLRECSKSVEFSDNANGEHKVQISTQFSAIEAAIKLNNQEIAKLDKTQESNHFFRDKLEESRASVFELTAGRDSFKLHSENLQKQIKSLEYEVCHLRNAELVAATEADVSADLKRQLEAKSVSLNEADCSVKKKENEIHDLEQRLSSALEQLAASTAKIDGLEAEKSQLQAQVFETEHRIRQELTRANMTAKQQSKALFEQEKHRYLKEKGLVEKSLEKVTQQLQSTLSSLNQANRAHEEAVVKSDHQEKELMSLRENNNRDSDHLLKISRLEEDHASCLARLKDIVQQSNSLKEEVAALQGNVQDSNVTAHLHEKINQLQSVILEKEAKLSSSEQLKSIAHANEAEITTLKNKLKCNEIEMEQMQTKLDQSTLLARDSEEKTKQNQIEEQHHKLQTLESSTAAVQENDTDRKLQSEATLDDVEQLLRRAGFLDTDETLYKDKNVVEKRLTDMASGMHRDLSLKEECESQERPAKRPRPTPKKRASSVFPEPFVPTTREVICHTYRIRESATPSSPIRAPTQRARLSRQKKEANGPMIRPFSQVEDEGHTAENAQASPMSELTDLNSLFPPTPPKGKELTSGTIPPATPINNPKTNTDTFVEVSATPTKASPDKMLLDDLDDEMSTDRARNISASNGQSNPDTVVPVTPNVSKSPIITPTEPAKPVRLPLDDVRHPKHNNEKAAPKSILKEVGNIKTPINQGKKVSIGAEPAPRPLTRATSKYFNPTVSQNPALIKTGNIFSVQGNGGTAAKVKPIKNRGRYGRKQKVSYNERFSRELK